MKVQFKNVFIATIAVLSCFVLSFGAFDKIQANDIENYAIETAAVSADHSMLNPESIAYGKTSAGDDVTIRTFNTSRDLDPGITVSVTKSKVIVQVNGVGSGGTANLYSYDPNDYHPKDTLRGLSTGNGYSATDIGEYKLGSNASFEFNRYVHGSGYDNLYRKFYIVKDGNIIAGPVYASEIEAYRDVKPFETNTKKGLICEDFSTINTAKEMGIGRTVINCDLGSLILANEDAKGNPIDNSKRPNTVSFESNGETFYFDTEWLSLQDQLTIPFSKAGINVTFVVIVWQQTTVGSKEYPESLRYDTGGTDTVTLGVNTGNPLGAKYVIAAMEFLAERYSKSPETGLVDRWVIANEIDYAYDWFLIQSRAKGSDGKYHKYDFNIFMEEFARYFRLSNAAVQKYNKNNKAYISLTHNWAESCLDSYGEDPNTSKRFFAWAPLDILEWMKKYDAPRGDFNWGITVHPYPIGTTSSNPCVTDLHADRLSPKWKSINGNYKTSPWITAANLELYQQYFDLPENKYKGTEMRNVILTETSICNKVKGTVSDEEYEESINEQAATIAMYYYRAAMLPCIDEVDYFEENDQPGSYALGLIAHDGTKKPSWTIWKYVDTELSFEYANRYLKYICEEQFKNATSYREFMDVVTAESGFNWDAYWDEAKIMTRPITGGESLDPAIRTDKDSYAGNEPILVTASGTDGNRVGLFKKSDDVNAVEPIYVYTLGLTTNGVKAGNGAQCDILAYGDLSASRSADKNLPAGDYKVVLLNGKNDKVKEFKITSANNFGSEEYSLSVAKNTFAYGEPVFVSATGPNNGSWVGIYGEDQTPQQVTSIFWYYVNDGTLLSGKPVAIQNQRHERDSLTPGNYKIILFNDGNYSINQTVHITVEEGTIGDLKSIRYTLNNNTDGFANGIVSVNRGDSGATDCVMFWADADGKPLEGYDSLQMFKLTDVVTDHKMVTHTFIPEGAKKLIAYGSNGSALSANYVSVDLPDSSTYAVPEDYIMEFQIMSDVHVTTPEGATGEVTLSNQHFKQMLEDIKHNSPDSKGMFINGDIANTGSEDEFKMVYNMYMNSVNAGDGTLPKIHMAIGNHDWMKGNPSKQFQRYVRIFNDAVEQPEEVYYDEVVNGYHFVYLGGEQPGLHAILSQKQLDWFDNLMAEITEEDPDKPVFVFIHQSFYNTVSGSLPGEGWNGVDDETRLMNIMVKYDQIILFNGHSHWHMNSIANMFAGDENHPVAFNTSAGGYLWNGYDVISGVYLEGSQGYYVRVYDDKVIFMGRNFDKGNWIPSALYIVEKPVASGASRDISLLLNGESQNIYDGARSGVDYVSSNTGVVIIKEDGTLVPMSVGTADVFATAPATDTTVVSRSKFKVSVINSNLFRIFGDNRYKTSLRLSDAYKAQIDKAKFDNVIVASGVNFADALAGSYLAAKKSAPILIVNDANIANVTAYIKENVHKNGTVYILGGNRAVSSKMESGLGSYNVKRLAGNNRYATNLQILDEADVWEDDILICTGNNFADSLSASASGKAIMLVKDQLTEDQLTFIKGHRYNKYYILGGDKAVTKAVENEINKIVKTERIAGASRYETSTMIAEAFFENPDTAVFAFANNFPDGLCAGPLAYGLNAPVILTATGRTDAAVEYIKNAKVVKGVVCGGSGLISNSDIRKIYDLDDKISITDWSQGKLFD